MTTYSALEKKILAAKALEDWVAFTLDGSAVVPFRDELAALRYAVKQGEMKVRCLREGVSIADLIESMGGSVQQADELRGLLLADADRKMAALALLEDPDIDGEAARVRAAHILRGEA